MEDSRHRTLELEIEPGPLRPGVPPCGGAGAGSAQTADLLPTEGTDLVPPSAAVTPEDTADLGPATGAATPADTADLEPATAADTADLEPEAVAAASADSANVELPSQLLDPAPVAATEEETLTFERHILGTKLAGCIIDARIGRGAVGSVFRARHVGLDKDVAVKILNPALFCLRRHVDQFFQEARAAASLEHPNIVAVYDVGQNRGLYYIVMQLIRGETLDDRIQREGKIGVTEAVRLTVEAASALGAAHEKGIVHRDVKPANLLLTRDGRLKVADFGLASRKKDAADANGRSEVAGTPYYIPPEQISGSSVDQRSDLYSLGVTLFYAVTGQRLDGTTPREILVKHLTEVPLPLCEIDPNLPRPLSEIVSRLLAKKPQSRTASASELIAQLEDLSREMAW